MPPKPEEVAFLDALRDDRGDATTRTVYADWLEQEGDLVRAELLRAIPSNRRAELAAITSNVWRRAALPPLTRDDSERLGLADALERIARSDHPAATQIGTCVQEWVEVVGDYDKEVLLYDGDLWIENGNLETRENPVAVLGDLFVENQISDPDELLLAVAGTTLCKTILQFGTNLFVGDVRCDVLYGSSLGTNRTEILGSLTAREAVIENGHPIVIHGTLTTTARLGGNISVQGHYLAEAGVTEAFDPALVDADGNVNQVRLYGRICDGESILNRSFTTDEAT